MLHETKLRLAFIFIYTQLFRRPQDTQIHIPHGLPGQTQYSSGMYWKCEPTFPGKQTTVFGEQLLHLYLSSGGQARLKGKQLKWEEQLQLKYNFATIFKTQERIEYETVYCFAHDDFSRRPHRLRNDWENWNIVCLLRCAWLARLSVATDGTCNHAAPLCGRASVHGTGQNSCRAWGGTAWPQKQKAIRLHLTPTVHWPIQTTRPTESRCW